MRGAWHAAIWRGRAAEGSLMADESFTELSGQRVVLRRFRPEDVDEFVAYRSRAEVARYQSWDAPYPWEEGERFVREIMTQHPDMAGEWFQFAVALRATGQLIGDCAAMPNADDPSQCEIGFTIAPGYQGRGYATEAVRLLVDYLFTALGKHRSPPAATRVMRRRSHCWNDWACGERVTFGRAPGPRASGPMICSMPCCVTSGTTAHAETTCPRLPGRGTSVAQRLFPVTGPRRQAAGLALPGLSVPEQARRQRREDRCQDGAGGQDPPDHQARGFDG